MEETVHSITMKMRQKKNPITNIIKDDVEGYLISKQA